MNEGRHLGDPENDTGGRGRHGDTLSERNGKEEHRISSMNDWEGRESGRLPLPESRHPLRRGRVPTGTHLRAQILERIERGIPLPVPSAEQVLGAVLSLNRNISLLMDEGELVEAHLEVIRDLLPGRRLSVKLVDHAGSMTLVYRTEEPTQIEESPTARISRPGLERHSLTPEAIDHPGVEVTERFTPDYASPVGFDVPLVDGDRISGVLAVEYYEGATPPEEDLSVVGQLALSLSSALRHGRVMRESLHLRDYLGKLLEHANAPIVVIGKRREVRVANRAMLEVTGLEREDLVGRDFLRILDEEERARILPAFSNALHGRPTKDFEVQLTRPGGGVARIAFNVASVLGRDGQVESVIAIGKDLTELRELEEQVIQSEKLATLGQLAAGVVHELNNPLTSISVYSEFLLKEAREQGAPAAREQKLARIVESAERILRFTRDLVTYARPSTEAPHAVSMAEVIEQSVVFCEHVLSEHGVTISKSFGEKSGLVLGVKGQLHQVFINLITNACHAMPLGAGHLELSIRSDDEWITASVHDNGSGIPDGMRDGIFEPFFSTKGQGKGTGLGLSIVRNILRQHGGEIEAISSPGAGTTFELKLPIHRR